MGSGIGPASRNLSQPITYWAAGVRGPDNFPTWAEPVLLYGRWAPLETLVRNTQGDNVNTHTLVQLSADVEENGYVAQGDQTGFNDPGLVAGSLEIKSFQSTPDLRNMEQQRVAYCG